MTKIASTARPSKGANEKESAPMASQPQRKTKGGPDDIDKHVGARIRLRRIRLGMSQEALGKSLGLTFQQVQKYEKGANRVGAGRLFQLSEVLEVPIQFFYDDIGDMIGAATGFAEDEPTDPFMDLVNSPDGIQLCRYFSEIEDAKVRKRVLELVRSIAETESGKSG